MQTREHRAVPTDVSMAYSLQQLTGRAPGDRMLFKGQDSVSRRIPEIIGSNLGCYWDDLFLWIMTYFKDLDLFLRILACFFVSLFQRHLLLHS